MSEYPKLLLLFKKQEDKMMKDGGSFVRKKLEEQTNRFKNFQKAKEKELPAVATTVKKRKRDPETISTPIKQTRGSPSEKNDA